MALPLRSTLRYSMAHVKYSYIHTRCVSGSTSSALSSLRFAPPMLLPAAVPVYRLLRNRCCCRSCDIPTPIHAACLMRAHGPAREPALLPDLKKKKKNKKGVLTGLTASVIRHTTYIGISYIRAECGMRVLARDFFFRVHIPIEAHTHASERGRRAFLRSQVTVSSAGWSWIELVRAGLGFIGGTSQHNCTTRAIRS